MEYLKEFNEYINDNFKKWFGNSKVVDNNGNPLKVYHGSQYNFNEFKNSQDIFRGDNGNFDINNPNINEHYDSPDIAKLNLSDEEIRKMVDLEPYKNKFQHGSYTGDENSAILNDLINKIEFNEMDEYGLVEYLYRMLIKEIPFFKEFDMNKHRYSDKSFILHLDYENEIKKNLDQKYSVKIEFVLEYLRKDDDILDYKKDTLKLWVFPVIKPMVNGGIGLFDKGEKKLRDKFKNDDIDGAIDYLQHRLYGTPDEEDKFNNEKFKFIKTNISIEEFINIIPNLKSTLDKFSNYVYAKYDVKLNN